MACKILFLVSNIFAGVGLVCLVISLLVEGRGPSVVAQGVMYLLAGEPGLVWLRVFPCPQPAASKLLEQQRAFRVDLLTESANERRKHHKCTHSMRT